MGLSDGFSLYFKGGVKNVCWFSVCGVEEKEKVRYGFKMFVLSNWKIGVVIYWDKIDYRRSWFGGEN